MSLMTKLFGIDPIIEAIHNENWLGAFNAFSSFVHKYAGSYYAGEFDKIVTAVEPALTALSDPNFDPSSVGSAVKIAVQNIHPSAPEDIASVVPAPEPLA